MKDWILFYQVNVISNIFMSGAAMSENITDDVHEMKKPDKSGPVLQTLVKFVHLTLYHSILTFSESNLGKEKMLVTRISPFPTLFSNLLKSSFKLHLLHPLQMLWNWRSLS